MSKQPPLLLSHNDVVERALQFVPVLNDITPQDKHRLRIYPVPRGGVPVAYVLLKFIPTAVIVDNPREADVFVDDIIDSGRTMKRITSQWPKPFLALVDKRTSPDSELGWIVFPWESTVNSGDDTIVGTITNRLKTAKAKFHSNDNIAEFINGDEEFCMLQDEVAKRAEHLLRGLLFDVDHDPNMKDTARRVAKMYLREAFAGRYTAPPKVTAFPNGKHLDELYVTGPITIRSCCAHHLCPITGKCWVGVIPNGQVIGLSKFNRIVHHLATRPQIQEELVVQIADAIQKETGASGIGVVLQANHSCLTWRGVMENPEAAMTTNVLRGALRDKPEARAEFLRFVGDL